MSEYEACKSGCITRQTSSFNFVTGYCFFMVKASQSTGLVITFFARPQFAFFVGIISSMVSSEIFEESYDLRVKLNVLLKLI
jgi:hypothetical protein